MIYEIKDCCKRYKKVLRRINKRRIRIEINNYINQCLEEETNNDLAMSEWITDANYQDYHMFEHDEWLKYLGRTWTLEDELEYCDKVLADCQPED